MIAAIEKGYYTDAGLDVDVVRGFGGICATNELDQGMFEFLKAAYALKGDAAPGDIFAGAK